MPKIKTYNLRIVPSNPVCEDVTHFKNLFKTKFGKQPLSQSKPHITVAAFKMDVEYQDILIKNLTQLSKSKRFTLTVQGFEIFKNNANVLLLNVPITEAFRNLIINIKVVWQRDLHRKLSTLKVSSTPHITISKTNGEEMLHESLAYFQEIGFAPIQIEVNHLTLVARPNGKTWDWEHHISLS